MRNWGETGTCRAKRGLLFLHDCGDAAVAGCHLCGRPVCMVHQTLDEVGTICPDCYVLQGHDTTADGIDDRRPGWRERYYDKFGYTPLSMDFDDEDYRSVEEETDAQPIEGIAALSKREADVDRRRKSPDDLDNYLES